MQERRFEPQNGGPVMRRIGWFAQHNICTGVRALMSSTPFIAFILWPSRSASHWGTRVSSWKSWAVYWRKTTPLAFVQWKQRGLEIL
jgi:hypothetical protein